MNKIKLVFIYLVALSLSCNSKNKKHTNLVFVFSDQQSWDMLSCYGNDQIRTPNLDTFANEGVRFNHCISSSPICTPYRGMLLSGQHPLYNGAMENDVRMIPGNGNYFAEVLRDAGYRTGYYGKWHLYGGKRNRPVPKGPYRYGFDYEFLTNNCTVVYDSARSYYWDENDQRKLYGEWESDGQTHQALEFIDENSDKPFALFLSWHPPHNWASGHQNTYLAPEEFMELYDPDSIQLRANVLDNDSIRWCYQGHMAMVSSLDRSFGWLMDRLKERGLDENTIVVFTSDHGDAIGSHGNTTNKLRPEQESIRVPLLLRFPGVLQPRVSDLLVGTLDLMPTLLSFMGITPPKTCHGIDLSSTIKKGDDNAVASVPLFCLPMDWRGIYTKRYTFAIDVSQGQQTHYRKWLFSRKTSIYKNPLRYNVLFDKQNDPNELNNLYYSEEYGEIREQLETETKEWMEKFEDTGLTYVNIAEKTKTQKDFEDWSSAKFGEIEGELKGRPSDLLKSYSKKMITH